MFGFRSMLCCAIIGGIGCVGRTDSAIEVSPCDSGNRGKNVIHQSVERGGWELNLDSVKITKETITEVRATLRNRTSETVTVDSAAIRGAIAMGIRLWRSGTDEVYGLHVLPEVCVDVFPEAFIIGPSGTRSLLWKCPTRCLDHNKYLYELAPLHEKEHMANHESVVIPAGTYAVDTIVDFAVWSPSETMFKKNLGSVSVMSSNKVWITIE